MCGRLRSPNAVAFSSCERSDSMARIFCVSVVSGHMSCRKCSKILNVSSLLELYSVLVRPHLEYAAPIWDPHLIKTQINLKSSKIYIKMCLKQWDLGYQDLHDLSQFPTLKNRRLYLKLCTLYKSMHAWLFLFSPQCILTPSK